MIKLSYAPIEGSAVKLQLSFKDSFGKFYVPFSVKYSFLALNTDKSTWSVVGNLYQVDVTPESSMVLTIDNPTVMGVTKQRKVLIEYTAFIDGQMSDFTDEVEFEVKTRPSIPNPPTPTPVTHYVEVRDTKLQVGSATQAPLMPVLICTTNIPVSIADATIEIRKETEVVNTTATIDSTKTVITVNPEVKLEEFETYTLRISGLVGSGSPYQMEKAYDFVFATGTSETGTLEDNKLITIEENGVIVITPDNESIGMKKVTATVNVSPEVNLQEKTVTENGVVTPDSGYDGLNKVLVNLPETHLQPKQVTENGLVTPDTGYDGLSQVTVNVQPNLQEKTITENGEVTADSEYDGLSKVTINVPSSEPLLQEKTATQNGTVVPDSGYDGLSKVTVNVEGGTELVKFYAWNYESTVVYTLSSSVNVGDLVYDNNNVNSHTGKTITSKEYIGCGDYSVYVGNVELERNHNEDVICDYVRLMNLDCEENKVYNINDYSQKDGFFKINVKVPVSDVKKFYCWENTDDTSNHIYVLLNEPNVGDKLYDENGYYLGKTISSIEYGGCGRVFVYVDDTIYVRHSSSDYVSGANFKELEVESNGTYTAESEDCDGFSSVTVNGIETAYVYYDTVFSETYGDYEITKFSLVNYQNNVHAYVDGRFIPLNKFEYLDDKFELDGCKLYLLKKNYDGEFSEDVNCFYKTNLELKCIDSNENFDYKYHAVTYEIHHNSCENTYYIDTVYNQSDLYTISGIKDGVGFTGELELQSLKRVSDTERIDEGVFIESDSFVNFGSKNYIMTDLLLYNDGEVSEECDGKYVYASIVKTEDRFRFLCYFRADLYVKYLEEYHSVYDEMEDEYFSVGDTLALYLKDDDGNYHRTNLDLGIIDNFKFYNENENYFNKMIHYTVSDTARGYKVNVNIADGTYFIKLSDGTLIPINSTSTTTTVPTLISPQGAKIVGYSSDGGAEYDLGIFLKHPDYAMEDSFSGSVGRYTMVSYQVSSVACSSNYQFSDVNLQSYADYYVFFNGVYSGLGVVTFQNQSDLTGKQIYIKTNDGKYIPTSLVLCYLGDVPGPSPK